LPSPATKRARDLRKEALALSQSQRARDLQKGVKQRQFLLPPATKRARYLQKEALALSQSQRARDLRKGVEQRQFLPSAMKMRIHHAYDQVASGISAYPIFIRAGWAEGPSNTPSGRGIFRKPPSRDT
jgi:hypothetical protein